MVVLAIEWWWLWNGHASPRSGVGTGALRSIYKEKGAPREAETNADRVEKQVQNVTCERSIERTGRALLKAASYII
jgi:hypothetical protein